METGPVKPSVSIKITDSALPAGASLKTIPEKNIPEKTIPVISSPVRSTPDVFKTAAQNLGLPPDFLSTTLLAFSKFFSITPDSRLFANLRKEILQSGSSSPKTPKEKIALEAKVLAALAAADKGVALGKTGFEIYSADSRNDLDSRHHAGGFQFYQQQYKEKNQNEENEEKDLFDIMNKIPGKNKQRWIILPFNYDPGGTELKVLLRILIKEPLSSSAESIKFGAGAVIIDISGPKYNWRFVLNKTGKDISVNIGIVPGLSSREIAGLRKEMVKNGFSGIKINNGRELPLSEALDLLDIPALPSVNKGV